MNRQIQPIVMKFGGTSLANPERIQHVANRILQRVDEGLAPIVVVSAMGGETDALYRSAQSVAPLAPALGQTARDRETAVIVASGEQKSAGLLSLALSATGHASRSFLGWQLPIETEDGFANARIRRIETAKVSQALFRNEIPVIAGFQGVDSSGGELTTLGRGGSDLTAVALTSALGLRYCEIYTDVDGVYDLDPGHFLTARRLSHITYAAMLAMAQAGAKVLQQECVAWARDHDISIHVRSSFHDGPGTIVNDYQPSWGTFYEATNKRDHGGADVARGTETSASKERHRTQAKA